jgi:hypothetical protein
MPVVRLLVHAPDTSDHAPVSRHVLTGDPVNPVLHTAVQVPATAAPVQVVGKAPLGTAGSAPLHTAGNGQRDTQKHSEYFERQHLCEQL